LILLAALLGLLAGWLIWGRRRAASEGSEMVHLRADLERCLGLNKEKDATIGRLEARLSSDFDKGLTGGVQPATLLSPRAGKADNLKKIRGIGPELEALCNRLGFWHFDQIAAWTDDEIAWVDANLEDFKGRVTRDKWVEQARLLAAGGETEFSRRVEAGEVYGNED
jgi:predicted flap endonuclease-1-like 5' DNA nuclease